MLPGRSSADIEVPAREVAEDIATNIGLEVGEGTVEVSDQMEVRLVEAQEDSGDMELSWNEDGVQIEAVNVNIPSSHIAPSTDEKFSDLREEIDEIVQALQDQIKVIAGASDDLSVDIRNIALRLEKVEEFHQDVANILTTLQKFKSGEDVTSYVPD